MAKVLLLEDMVQLRRLLTKVLGGEGHDVTAFGDGLITQDSDALSGFDVMITDLVMPRVDGLEAIRAAKTNCPNLKIIAMSGGGRNLNEDYLPSAGVLGAEVTLNKPFEPDVLIEAIRKILAE